MIKNDPAVSISQIVTDTGFSRLTVTRAIAVLKDKNLISRTGAKKNGHWVV